MCRRHQKIRGSRGLYPILAGRGHAKVERVICTRFVLLNLMLQPKYPSSNLLVDLLILFRVEIILVVALIHLLLTSLRMMLVLLRAHEGVPAIIIIVVIFILCSLFVWW